MPIAFTCPHCGKSTTVADQFAGQSGPCAGCGQIIQIPFSSGKIYGAPPPAKSSGAGVAVIIVVIICVALGGLVVCLGLPALLLPAIQKTRSAASRANSMNNMRQIMLAIHNYHDVHGELPPAIVKDAEGKPLYSGMVLLLPYLEQANLHRQFDLSKPWDAPENRHISMMTLPLFQNPATPPNGVAGRADYLFVGGPKSALGADGKNTLANIADGTSNTIVLVEVKGNAHSWAEPLVWTPDQPLDSDTAGGVGAATADGAVHTLSRNIPRDQLQRLVERDDMQPVSIP